MFMPDIQAGKVEVTKREAARFNKEEMESSNQMKGFMFVDELGESHEESAQTHLGHS